jgi:hypothetical protein
VAVIESRHDLILLEARPQRSRRIESAPPIIHEIAAQSNRLSPKGQRNILAIIQWIELGGID